VVDVANFWVMIAHMCPTTLLAAGIGHVHQVMWVPHVLIPEVALVVHQMIVKISAAPILLPALVSANSVNTRLEAIISFVV